MKNQEGWDFGQETPEITLWIYQLTNLIRDHIWFPLRHLNWMKKSQKLPTASDVQKASSPLSYKVISPPTLEFLEASHICHWTSPEHFKRYWSFKREKSQHSKSQGGENKHTGHADLLLPTFLVSRFVQNNPPELQQMCFGSSRHIWLLNQGFSHRYFIFPK